MDNEKLASSGEPVSVASRSSASAAPSTFTVRSSTPLAPDRERTGVFTSLVREDGDISGLVAYSIYKQNKLDWLQAFEAATGRTPTEAELSSYIIGESTPRRLATYRHLAESTLAGKGPDVDRAAPGRAGSLAGGQANLVTPRTFALYAFIAVLCVLGFWLAAHYTAH